MSGTAPVRRSGEVVGGKYHVLRVLAEGGMGVVYEAQHVVVKRRFAIKFLRPDFADRREILARFHREAQTAGALESENIAAAIDFGILGDGTPYIVMEYLVGESLGSLLAREERLPVERAADLCLQACRGIESAHASGIVHRDLKPENLFVCRRDDGTDLIKVLDFGIAKLEQMESNSAATRTGTILGTPAYMSPEQARGDRMIDHRTDVYGLGAILFEMLSGKKPHPGDSHNAILHHISTQPALQLRSVQPDLPAPLLDAVERALASDPRRRHASAEALSEALAPFAKRTVWPAATQYGSGSGANETSSTPGARLARLPALPAGRIDAEGSTIVGSGQPLPPRRGARKVIAVGAGLVAATAIVAAIVTGPGRSRQPPTTVSLPRTRGDRALPRDTRFFVPPPMPGAVQQIAALVKQKAFADAAPLTAMAATPQAVWFIGGSPDDVRSAVQNTMVRAAPDRRVPVLVANNIPFRDCAQYSAGGATSTTAYQAWIDGFANGIGNGRAVVILEPDSLGIIPYNNAIDGSSDWCKPTIADAQGRTIPAPGATPADRYAQINHAVDSIVSRAPNASVYLDGTHAGWLGVGEIAQRLVKAGVQRAQGFFVNLSNFQPTPQSIQYGTWISKCIYYANNPAEGGRRLGRYADCTSQYSPAKPDDYSTWALTEKWYVDNVDHAPNPPAGASALTHFVIDTSRNGRGTLDVLRYAAAPYNQPVEVLKGLKGGNWCNPPNAGLGLRPSADTRVPLVDAFLWVKVPGGSDGSCDIAGGARAWEYARYNPWGIEGDAENHFDPLWAAVDPAAGEWFADEALQLAQNASPPLQAAAQALSRGPDDEENGNEGTRGRLGAAIAATIGSQPSASGMHPAAQTKRAASPPGRPRGRPPGRPDQPRRPEGPPAPSVSTPPTPTTASRPTHVTFDPQNPYGN